MERSRYLFYPTTCCRYRFFFRAHLYWVHREKIAFDIPERGESEGDWKEQEANVKEDDARPALNDLIRLWLLGDRLLELTLRNRVIDALVYIIRENAFWWDDSTRAITPDMISSIWSKTTSGRSIRRVVADFFCLYGWFEEVEDVMDQLDTGSK